MNLFRDLGPAFVLSAALVLQGCTGHLWGGAKPETIGDPAAPGGAPTAVTEETEGTRIGAWTWVGLAAVLGVVALVVAFAAQGPDDNRSAADPTT